MPARRKLTPATPTPSDIEISDAADPLPITEIAADLNLRPDEVFQYGPVKAKVILPKVLPRVDGAPHGTYVVVSALTPTSYGEGKSTTTIGLTQAIGSHLELPVCACVRQASMGPTFGVKGGAAGGGYSQAIPMPDFNLHLTGDIHAIAAATNLMCAALDTVIFHETTQPLASLFRRLTTDASGKRNFAPQHIHRLKRRGLMPADAPLSAMPDPTSFTEEQQATFAKLNIDQSTIAVHRCVDMNDRMLRVVKTGQGKEEAGKPACRDERFEITVASEVMGVLALSADLRDLRERLGRIVVARDTSGNAVTTDDIGVAGSMAVLLKDAIDPNLMQTLEGNPVLVHCGPFGNIAHGNSSIVADRVALPLVGEKGFVLTEAGFGADMGLEKFVNIKCRVSGLTPAVAVVVATVRAVKAHDPEGKEDLERGFSNLGRHIKNVVAFGMRAVVVLNKFKGDTDEELAKVKSLSEGAGAFRAVVSEHFSKGGAGAVDAAKAVVEAAEESKRNPQPLSFTYSDDQPLVEKIRAVVKKVYGGDDIALQEGVAEQLEKLEGAGYGKLPVCMAKTQYSFSHDPTLKGAPTGFTVPVMEVFLNAGLTTRPAYLQIDLESDGRILGLS